MCHKSSLFSYVAPAGSNFRLEFAITFFVDSTFQCSLPAEQFLVQSKILREHKRLGIARLASKKIGWQMTANGARIKLLITYCSLMVMLSLASRAAVYVPSSVTPPKPNREFRTASVAT